MPNSAKLRIVVVSTFYSEGMGYTENCLPRALAELGHEVHLVTSTYNVYGNSPNYDATYAAFLGPAVTQPGEMVVDGYRVHRLPAATIGGYPRIRGLGRAVRRLEPDVAHALEIASLDAWMLALNQRIGGYRLFCETHQHMSVVRPYLKRRGAVLKKAVHWATRTAPTSLASLAVERCYAISPDCAEVAEQFYGVPRHKLTIQSLGTDTSVFHPVDAIADTEARRALRASLGFAESDVVCVYSGRFSPDKNPAVLARAIDRLNQSDTHYKGLFIGDGVQRNEIATCKDATILPFMNHRRLAEHYRAADIAVWPTQESVSMLDAASSGIPIVVSHTIGEASRIRDNGVVYEENDVESLADALRGLADADRRSTLGRAGRRRMVDGFSWKRSASAVVADYQAALAVAT